MVGMPCVSSSVGGIPEYVTHQKNGCLYRFEEYPLAVSMIENIFDDDVLAETLSKNARESMMQLHEGNDLYQKIVNTYTDILERERIEKSSCNG